MRRYFLISIFLLLTCLSSFGQVLQLSEGRSDYRLGKYLQLYEDTLNVLSIEQISAAGFADKLAASTKENPSFGTTKSAFWAKFEFEMPAAMSQKEWLLSLESTEFGEVELYRIVGGRPVKQSLSASESFDSRPVKHRFYLFPISPEIGKNIFYIKIRFDRSSSLPLVLTTADRLRELDHDDQAVFGILYGILFAMIVYNFFLFFYLREKIYLLYCLRVLFYTLWQMAARNFLFEYLWPDNPYWNRIAYLPLFSVGMIFSALFAMSYLNTAKYLPKVNYVFYAVIGTTVLWCSAALIAYFGFDTYIGAAGVQIAFLLQFILLIVVPIIVIRKGYRPAVFFMLAFMFVLSGGLTDFLRTAAIIPTNAFTNHAGLFGSVFETLMLALGLAYKINQMRERVKQKEVEAERIKREEEEKRNALIRKQNQELEGKVADRTKDLETVNKNLHEVNEEVNRQNEELYEKSEEIALQKIAIEQKNEEVLQQNEEIQQQNEELIAVSERLQEQNMQVSIKNTELEKQNKIIDSAHRSIKASINYAKRIQMASLPRQDFMEKIFPQHFILYQPRDVVSGDFYWATEVTESIFDPKNPLLTKIGRSLKILVTADCTGHGVPGALMSMIGSNILDQTVKDRKITEPGLILRTMDLAIKTLLKQTTGDNRDGMDATVLSIHEENKTVYFSGAKRPLVYFQNEELTTIKGSTGSVGGEDRRISKHFDTHTVSYAEAPVMLYTFSDGYADQIGGPNDKKLMIKAFRDFLEQVHSDSMEKQKETLERRFNDWIGQNRQLDDILVVGLRLE